VGTSAHHPKYWDEKLVQFANSRGRGKVLYGTDYPVMNFADSLSAVKDLNLKDSAHDLLIGGAARKIFKLL
jgi:predicted TIM-barrel fold metal-dependent hydrolase